MTVTTRALRPAPSPLASALRALRRARGLKAGQVARAMGLPLRTYRHFEAGDGQATPERLRDFARVTESDYAALLLCAGGLEAAVALACADNKALTVAIGAVEDLHADLSTALSSLTAADLLAAFDAARRRLQAGAVEKSRARLRQAETSGATLSPRQLECLRWAQAGKSSTDIGAILEISRRTVETHISEACARLGVRTRVQAISLIIEMGLLSPHPP